MKGIEGSTLGRYELRRRVARGGMSEVYLGYDRRVRRRVAVKVLYGSDEPFVRRFEREALAVGALSHDHILPLYDFGEQRPWYYLVMPFVEGGTLRDFLLKRESLTLEEAGSFLDQIASALQYAHDHGVVHRDVKPSNILLRLDGYAYLGDFGLAKAKMEAESLTHSGTMIGTPEYMAPEQSDGVSDQRSDIYSLGIILYQMLTGRVPFTADTPVAVSLKHLQSPPPSPLQFKATIPTTIEDVMLKALAKNPAERYQQARELAIAYRKALQQERTLKSGELSILPLQSQKIVALPHNDGEKNDRAAPIAAEDEFAQITTTQLFPLGAEAPSLPSMPALPLQKRGYKRRLLITMLLCLLIIGTTIPLALLRSTPPIHRISRATLRQTPTPSTQRWATATAHAQATIQATLAAQARVRGAHGMTSSLAVGTVAYGDALTYSSGGWLNDGRQCSFTSAGYHVITSLRNAVAWCYNDQHSFSNAIITVQAQLLHGAIYGLMFRLAPDSKAFYVLELNGQGEYRFVRAFGSDPGNWLTLVDWTASNALFGYGSTNTLLIIANGGSFRFYVNKQLIASTIYDSSYAAGFLGFLVGNETQDYTEAVFRNLGVFLE